MAFSGRAFLAAKGIEVLRYDYRGVGEQYPGRFEDMTFESWADDVQCLSAWLRKRGEDVPLVLHGLEMGGVLAGRAFDGRSVADALLLLVSACPNANQVLRSTLQRWIGPQQLLKSPRNAGPLVSLFSSSSSMGRAVEIEGYRWDRENCGANPSEL